LDCVWHTGHFSVMISGDPAQVPPLYNIRPSSGIIRRILS